MTVYIYRWSAAAAGRRINVYCHCLAPDGDGKVVVEFRPGDGHDVILGSGYADPAPGWIEYWDDPTDPGKTWGVKRNWA